MFRQNPLIVILGSTGTGKTKLSIELAKRFSGEIVSADSMQVYKGLNICTAKATKDEQAAAPHHMLDIATSEQPFTVLHFRETALPIIDDILGRSKVPIVVGGTNYYIESLLWKVLVAGTTATNTHKDTTNTEFNLCKQEHVPTDSSSACKRIKLNNADERDNKEDDEKRRNELETAESILNKNTAEEETTTAQDSTTNKLDTLSSEELHEYLKKFDPTTANRLHPNNRRKILRAIEVYKTTGKLLSSILHEQRQIPGGSNLGGPLRYPHVVIFWLRCDQEVLNQRLDARVDTMVAQGLLEEIRNFHLTNKNDDYAKGILQTIGFKEFLPYLREFDESEDAAINNYLSLKDNDNLNDLPVPKGLAVLNNCLDELKLVTKRYSRKQIKWINNRFLGNQTRQVPDLYKLDTTDVLKWNEAVYEPALNVVKSYIEDVPPKVKAMSKIQTPRAGLNEEVTNFCDICKKVLIGEYQWNIHRASNKHKKMIARNKKLSQPV